MAEGDAWLSNDDDRHILFEIRISNRLHQHGGYRLLGVRSDGEACAELTSRPIAAVESPGYVVCVFCDCVFCDRVFCECVRVYLLVCLLAWCLSLLALPFGCFRVCSFAWLALPMFVAQIVGSGPTEKHLHLRCVLLLSVQLIQI